MKSFTVGQRVRYKPGQGTYGYEDALGSDGRLPGVVIGHSATRVRVRLQLGGTRQGSLITRCVDARSLLPIADTRPATAR